MQDAKRSLIEAVQGYADLYRKGNPDQRLLMPEKFRHLIWWTFPSEVAQEIIDEVGKCDTDEQVEETLDAMV